jgi:hypothetical protein
MGSYDYSHEAAYGCFSTLFSLMFAFLVTVVVSLLLSEQYVAEGISLSIFFAAMGIGDILLKAFEQKKLSKSGVIVAIVSLIWFTLAMLLPGSFFRLEGLLDVMLSF